MGYLVKPAILESIQKLAKSPRTFRAFFLGFAAKGSYSDYAGRKLAVGQGYIAGIGSGVSEFSGIEYSFGTGEFKLIANLGVTAANGASISGSLSFSGEDVIKALTYLDKLGPDYSRPYIFQQGVQGYSPNTSLPDASPPDSAFPLFGTFEWEGLVTGSNDPGPGSQTFQLSANGPNGGSWSTAPGQNWHGSNIENTHTNLPGTSIAPPAPGDDVRYFSHN